MRMKFTTFSIVFICIMYIVVIAATHLKVTFLPNIHNSSKVYRCPSKLTSIAIFSALPRESHGYTEPYNNVRLLITYRKAREAPQNKHVSRIPSQWPSSATPKTTRTTSKWTAGRTVSTNCWLIGDRQMLFRWWWWHCNSRIECHFAIESDGRADENKTHHLSAFEIASTIPAPGREVRSSGWLDNTNCWFVTIQCCSLLLSWPMTAGIHRFSGP